MQETRIATELKRRRSLTRFYREPEVHEQEGIGIGLFLARQIMELQKGYIEVRSEAGLGSEFILYFPNEE
ncbi:MAG: ATP-binding protein [Lachnospiraceae bacterium]